MRTTLNTIYARVQTNLNKVTSDIDRINSQISSGSQLNKIGDNPVNLTSALNFRSSIVEIQQYQENISHGNTLISASEAALTQMKDLALRSKTLAIQATDPALDTSQLRAIAEEIGNMFEESILLANSQLNGQYIFGGHRTTGYTDEEPAPFIVDQANGHWINGSGIPSMTDTPLTGTIPMAAPDLQDIASGDLLINGVNLGAVALLPAPAPAPAAPHYGLNMSGADAIRTAVNLQTGTTGVTAAFTTLVTGAAATADTADATDSEISFDLNGTTIEVTIADGSNAAAVAQAIVDAINTATGETGVEAEVGTGANGGPADAVVFRNAEAGDETAITVTGFSLVAGDAGAGFGNFSQSADATHNTGEISLSSSDSFIITSPNHTDDSMLAVLGLDGGGQGFVDDASDGTLIYGYRLADGDLSINGFDVPATTTDGLSDVLTDASAAAKATAINSIQDDTGVTATVIPASVNAAAAVDGGTETERLTGLVTNAAIVAGDLAINGTPVGAINGGAVFDGLNMGKAFNARAAINDVRATSGVSARLTTLLSGIAATAPGTTQLSFTLNGIGVSLTTGGISASDTAATIASAINELTSQTGVEAVAGTGTNGGPADSVVLRNAVKGNENAIVVAGLSVAEQALSGLANVSQAADLTHNTGEISLESNAAFNLTSPTTSPASDAILYELGLMSDTGIGTPTSGTGEIDFGATPRYLESGDLVINGVDIFSIPTAILAGDSDNTLVTAINAQSATTGILASREANGVLLLTAVDGRNLHVETSLAGESATHLNGGSQDKIHFGTIQLSSERKFFLESATGPLPNSYEAGFVSLGMAGGAAVTGETDDVTGDGRIEVYSIHNQTGTVRYTGDREGFLAVKISKTSTMVVGENGQSAVADSGIFSVLKSFENALRGQEFTTVTGIHAATDTTALLNSRTTGLEPDTLLPEEDLFTAGSFTVTMTDRDYDPPRSYAYTIGVDPEVDTLASVTERINGIPHLSASWTADGHLKIESDDPNRYRIALGYDSSNFLEATGTSASFMQVEAFQKAIADLDTVMNALSEQISDFGARANRVQVQSQIYSNMLLMRRENLSEVQDTDMIQAIMELKAKEVAYQAALNAAAKTMQLSLVDFL